MWPETFGVFAQTATREVWDFDQFLFQYPWLIIVCMALLIPIVGIIFGSITDYLRKTRLAEIDAALKRDMLERGMNAEQIKMVLEASPTNKHKHKC
jgi:hypothetical protein